MKRSRETKKISLNSRKGGQSCGFHSIQISHISVQAGGDEILRDVNLQAYCGTLTAIIGRNGAGKSTLLKAILGEIPHEGEVIFSDIRENPLTRMEKSHLLDADGNDFHYEGMDTSQRHHPTLTVPMKRHHIQIGYVPQSLHLEKNTPTSVYDLIAGYITRVPIFFRCSKKVKEQVRRQLAIFQAEELIDKVVCDLSGGELQRVLLALAIHPIPNLLVLDEPAAGIDQKGIQMFYETLQRIKEEYDMAVLLVSHDLEYVQEYADQVVLLNQTVVLSGSTEMVFASREYQEEFGLPSHQ